MTVQDFGGAFPAGLPSTGRGASAIISDGNQPAADGRGHAHSAGPSRRCARTKRKSTRRSSTWPIRSPRKFCASRRRPHAARPRQHHRRKPGAAGRVCSQWRQLDAFRRAATSSNRRAAHAFAHSGDDLGRPGHPHRTRNASRPRAAASSRASFRTAAPACRHGARSATSARTPTGQIPTPVRMSAPLPPRQMPSSAITGMPPVALANAPVPPVPRATGPIPAPPPPRHTSALPTAARRAGTLASLSQSLTGAARAAALAAAASGAAAGGLILENEAAKLPPPPPSPEPEPVPNRADRESFRTGND